MTDSIMELTGALALVAMVFLGGTVFGYWVHWRSEK